MGNSTHVHLVLGMLKYGILVKALFDHWNDCIYSQSLELFILQLD